MVHEGTSASATRTTDAAGEFAFDFLRVGAYTLRIEARGFKRYESKGIGLVATQTVRQTFALEVGAITETVTVEGMAPLVSTASAEQLETFKLAEMPLGRRNVSGILRLTTGVDMGAGRSPRLNGIGASGTGISVDGTDANSNPEQRSMAQYGARNYIDVMSVDAIQEVQLVRGILAAEYGGVLGGQVNILSKSGANGFHGSAFENYDSHALNARNPFVAARTADGGMIPKPRVVFNQFGGSMGGPVIRDRLFFSALMRVIESRHPSGGISRPPTRPIALKSSGHYLFRKPRSCWTSYRYPTCASMMTLAVLRPSGRGKATRIMWWRRGTSG